MKILKLQQPFATMTVKGLLPAFKDVWQNNISPGERVYVFATKSNWDCDADSVFTYPDIECNLQRKIYNNILWGNLKIDLPTRCFVGYVHVGEPCEKPPIFDCNYFKNDKSFFYSENPRYFVSPESNKDADQTLLDSLKTRKCNPLRFSFSEGELIVPLGPDVRSSTLFDINEYENMFMCIEDDMLDDVAKMTKKKRLQKTSLHTVTLTRINSISFVCGMQTIKFDISKYPIRPTYENKPVFCFTNLILEDYNVKVLRFGLPSLHRNDELYTKLFGLTESKPDYDINNEYVHFLKTPMGGANKRR